MSDYTTGLTRWWRASTIAQADNTVVATWADSSASADNAIGYAGTQPKYRTNIINTQPAVLFDSSNNQSMDFTNGISLGDFTIMIVQATSVDNVIIGNKTLNRQIRIGGSGVNKLSMWDGSTEPLSSVLSTVHDTTHFSLIEYSRSGTAGTFFENGVAIGGGVFANALALDRISSYGASVPPFLPINGYIAEIRIWPSALSYQNAADARYALMSLYGLLPINSLIMASD